MIKKIVFLHPAHWEQAFGGAELQISYLVRFFMKQNYEVHFIFEDKNVHIINNDKIFLHPLKKIKIGKTLGQRWFLYGVNISLKLNEIKPDVIYTRFYSSWSGFASRYAKKNNIKHVWALASDTDVQSKVNLNLVLKPFDILEYFICKYAFKNTSVIISQNEFQSKSLKNKFQRNSVKIPQMAAKEGLYSSNQKSKAGLNIVWIGNLKTIKRPEVFLNLVNNLKNSIDFNFIMIGRPAVEYEDQIRNLYKSASNFVFEGEKSNDFINRILSTSHILVNTSEAEGFSNTFVQAWLHRVITLSMKSNPDEILTFENIGFICPTEEDLIAKLQLLNRNREVLAKMGERAIDYARNNHLLTDSILKVFNLID